MSIIYVEISDRNYSNQNVEIYPMTDNILDEITTLSNSMLETGENKLSLEKKYFDDFRLIYKILIHMKKNITNEELFRVIDLANYLGIFKLINILKSRISRGLISVDSLIENYPYYKNVSEIRSISGLVIAFNDSLEWSNKEAIEIIEKVLRNFEVIITTDNDFELNISKKKKNIIILSKSYGYININDITKRFIMSYDSCGYVINGIDLLINEMFDVNLILGADLMDEESLYSIDQIIKDKYDVSELVRGDQVYIPSYDRENTKFILYYDGNIWKKKL